MPPPGPGISSGAGLQLIAFGAGPKELQAASWHFGDSLRPVDQAHAKYGILWVAAPSLQIYTKNPASRPVMGQADSFYLTQS